MRLAHVVGMIVAVVMFAAQALAQDFLVGSWSTRAVHRYDSVTGQSRGVFVPAGSGGLQTPDGLAYGPDGNLYVSSAESNQILRYNGVTGAFIDVFAATGINRAGYCAFGPDGNLYVCSSNSNQVLRFNGTTGASMGVFASGGGMAYPAGIAWLGTEMYVSGFGDNRVHRFRASNGVRLGTLSGTYNRPLYIRVADGDLFISDYGNSRIVQYDLATNAGIANLGVGVLNGPVGQLNLPDGNVIVTSWNDGRLYKYSASGTLLSTIDTTLAQPNDLVLMPVPSPGVGLALLAGVGLASCRPRR